MSKKLVVVIVVFLLIISIYLMKVNMIGKDKLIIQYIIFINCLSFVLYGIDKIKAKYNKWRIPEKTLLLLSIIGGAFGATISMYLFRHKTKKIKFKIVNYLGLIIWLSIFVILIIK